MKTQKQRILDILRRRKNGATNGELIFETRALCPWKRITELEADGYTFDYYSEWHQPKSGRGAWLTRYVLVGEPKGVKA